MDSPGTFIVIEGSDGSGKGTQFRLLKERLAAVGYDVEVFDFPQYDKNSSHFVKEYLNGHYGPASSVSPYTASLFYALDRYEAAPQIRKALAQGKIVLCNRYVGSNMAHQGGKFADPMEQRSFFVWEDSLEYQLLNIPRPNLNVFLKVPAEIAQELVAQKKAREYTDKSHDEHEADIEHLKKSVATYELMCQLFPNDFKLVDCTEGGKLQSIPDINNKIWEIVRPLLPAKPSKPGHSVVVKLNEQTAKAAVKDQAEPKHTAELSLAAIYEAWLAGLPVEVKGSSWAKTGYKYYKPNLPKKTLAKYNEYLNKFVELHKAISKKVKDPAVLASCTPLAALCEVSIDFAKAPKYSLSKLQMNKNPEISELVSKAGIASRSNGRGGSKNSAGEPEQLSNIIARIASEHLPQNLAAEVQAVELLEAWPRNEFKVLADAIYPYSNLSKAEIEGEITGWSYQQKADTLLAAFSSDNGVKDKLSYQFDLTVDKMLLDEIIFCAVAEDIQSQPATPRYGYEVPAVVDEAGVADEYLDCFDKSLELFSSLQAAGCEDLAVYATLAGHKTRYQLTCTMNSLTKALDYKDSAKMADLMNLMIEKIAEHHPLVAEQLANSQTKPEKRPPAEKKAEPKPTAKAKESSANKTSRSRSRSRRRGNKPKKS